MSSSKSGGDEVISARPDDDHRRRPRPSEVAWKVLPDFAPVFFNLFCGQRDAQIRPKTLDALERFSWRNVFAQALGVLQKLLLFLGRERPHGFQDGLFETDHAPSLSLCSDAWPFEKGEECSKFAETAQDTGLPGPAESPSGVAASGTAGWISASVLPVPTNPTIPTNPAVR